MRLALGAAALALVLAAAPARAQDAERVEGARALFERGVSELAEERYDDAIASFRASLALHAVPATAFNLAIALGDRGHRAEAVEVLLALLDGEHGALEADRVDTVRMQLETVRGSLAVLTLRVESETGAAAFVDGRSIDLDEHGMARVALEPGEVHVRAIEGETDIEREETITLAAHEDRELVLRLEAQPELTLPVDPVEAPSDRDPPIEDQPALWFGVGAGVLVAAAAVVLGVVFGTQGGGGDPVLFTATTLRF